MRNLSSILDVAIVTAAAALPAALPADPVDPAAAMHWRQIGPTRAGRTRALSGVPSQPNVFYIGFDNGGVWRSTDYGSNWVPLFDREPTGSIRAIAAPRPIPTSSTSARAAASSAPTSPPATAPTSRPTPAGRGRTSASPTR